MKMEEKTPQKMGVWNSMCYTVQTIWRADKGCILLSFYKNCTEEVYMSFLRKKLKAINSKVKIKAVRGIGYKIEFDT